MYGYAYSMFLLPVIVVLMYYLILKKRIDKRFDVIISLIT